MSKDFRKGILRYPRHTIDPQDLLQFVELRQFSDRWARLGLDDEGDLFALQLFIMANPKGAPVIEGTGGLRKMRFAPAKWNIGKRGAARICFAYFEEHGLVLLVTAYDHKEKDNLSSAEKKGIKSYLEQTHHYLSTRNYR
jgi:hypothetical protein